MKREDTIEGMIEKSEDTIEGRIAKSEDTNFIKCDSINQNPHLHLVCLKNCTVQTRLLIFSMKIQSLSVTCLRFRYRLYEERV